MPTPIRVGIIANPVSARDIRRVMSHAAGLPLAERANMVLRIVQALAACGVDEVWLMPETEGLRTHLARLLPAAAAESAYPLPELVWADMPVRACTQDSTRAAEIMHAAGVRAIIVLGGDGTHRAVVKGCGRTPIAGISTGTNNAFPPMREATVTAFATGLYAVGKMPAATALAANKCLHIRRLNAAGDLVQQDIALIDAKKAVDMFQKVNIPIFGVLENMSVHICSHCGHSEAIFGHDGGKHLADKLGVPLLGQLPLSLPVREAMDAGTAKQMQEAQPAIAEIYTHAAWALALAVADKGKDFSSRFPKIVVE